MKENFGLMRVVVCCVAAVVYIWQVNKRNSGFLQYSSPSSFSLVGVMSLGLCLFVRPAQIQPPEPVARVLHFIGRHTLEIYAIQLAGSELLVKLVPALAPDPRPVRAAGYADLHPRG